MNPAEQAPPEQAEVTGFILSDEWARLLNRSGVLEVKKYPNRLGLAWTNKPPMNGKREVARRIRQMTSQ